GKFTTPFQWDEDPDQQAEPIFVCFLMASSPADTDVSHIEIIAKIATLLINDQFVESLKEEISAQQLLDKISSLIGED
ncbi:MAG: PTS sugar transporter subunit IIA, partial [Anaerolineales bacterium]